MMQRKISQKQAEREVMQRRYPVFPSEFFFHDSPVGGGIPAPAGFRVATTTPTYKFPASQRYRSANMKSPTRAFRFGSSMKSRGRTAL